MPPLPGTKWVIDPKVPVWGGYYADAAGTPIPEFAGAMGDYRPPPPGKEPTAADNAQTVLTKYWKWAANGAKTVPGAPDAKGNPTVVAVDPDTGQPAPDFPTVADVTAARAEITAKLPDDPALKAQAAATLDETLKRTALVQSQIDAAKIKPTRPNVVPGEGVWDPTANGGAGGYTVPVPTKPPVPTAPPLNQQQVTAQASADLARTGSQTNLANAQAGAIVSPDEAYRQRLGEINATAHAQGQAKLDEAKASVDAGLTLTEADKAKLTADLQSIQSDHDASIAQAKAQYDHDLAQPNTEINQHVAQQQADTQSAAQQANALSQQQQAQQASTNEQVTALTSQAAQGQANVDRVVKAGSATPISAATLRMATQPLELAFQLAHQQVAMGALPPSAIPTPPGAPQPAQAAPGSPQAPLPAPGVQPADPSLLPAGVAGTDQDPRFAGTVPPPRGAY